MLLVDDLAAGGTKNLRHTPRGLVTLTIVGTIALNLDCDTQCDTPGEYLQLCFWARTLQM